MPRSILGLHKPLADSPMGSLESAIRLMVIGQELLIAAIFLVSGGSRVLRWSAALLMLSVVGYLVTSSPALRVPIAWLLPVTMLLAVSVPYCLWLFARAVFEAPWPHPVVATVPLVIGLAAWVVNLFEGLSGTALQAIVGTVMRATALIIVVHALWLAMTGRPDDLVERRRSFRLLFVGIVAAQVIAVLIMELVLGGVSPPPWLELTNVLVILGITLGLAIPLLRVSPEILPLDISRPPAAAPAENNLAPAAGVYRDKLLDLMAGGAYRETGLTISRLAGQLDYPEHQLRRLINRHLGFRNFSAFLNSYRIDEARKRLADPDDVRLPILTIALDLGYGSLGPFNRAFKEATGTTPTDFRKRALARKLAETG